MSTVLDELVHILGVEIDPKVNSNIQKFSAIISEATKGVAWLSAGLVAAASSALMFAKDSNEISSELEKFSRITGQNTDSLQQWGYAAIAAGGDAKSVQADIRHLIETMDSPIPGKFNQGLMMLLGTAYDTTKDIDQVLMDLRDRFEGMTPKRQLQWSAELGISDDTLLMLKMSRQELTHIREEAKRIPVILTKEQLRNAMEFSIRWQQLNARIDYFGKVAATVAGPALDKMVKGLDSFIEENKVFIQSTLSGLIDGSIDGFDRFSKKLKEIVGQFHDFKGPDEPVDIKDFVSDATVTGLTALGSALTIYAAGWAAVAVAIADAVIAYRDWKKYTTSEGQEPTRTGWLKNLFDEYIGYPLQELKEDFDEYSTKSRGAESPKGKEQPGVFDLMEESWKNYKPNKPTPINKINIESGKPTIIQPKPLTFEKPVDKSTPLLQSIKDFLQKIAINTDLMIPKENLAMLMSPVGYSGQNIATNNTTTNHNQITIPVTVYDQTGNPQRTAQVVSDKVSNILNFTFPGNLKPTVG